MARREPTTTMHILDTLYKNKDIGLMRASVLLAKAKLLRPSITMADVKRYRGTLDTVKEAPYVGFNSFVASLPREEYQIDIAYMKYAYNFMGGTDKQKAAAKRKGPVFALVCIDSFSKFAAVEPVYRTTSDETTRAIKLCFTKMGGAPKTIYSDDGPEFKLNFDQYLKEDPGERLGVEHVITKTHAAFAERFIRTMKRMINMRLQYDNSSTWVELLPAVMTLYNHGKSAKSSADEIGDPHSAHNMPPIKATDDKNALNVKLALMKHAVHKRATYPPLDVGNDVLVYKKRGVFAKEHTPQFKPTPQKVQEAEWKDGQKIYKIANESKLMMRHEIKMY